MSTDTAPATKQKNYRLPVDLAERLDAKAAELDVNAVDIVVEGLERELRRLGRGGELKLIASAKPSKRRRHRRSGEASLGRAPSEGAAAGDSRPAASPRDAVHLAALLGTWTGMPAALMAREILAGRVTVDGVVPTDLSGPVTRDRVRWNGEPV